MGCGLCKVYCQTAHSKSKDVLKAFKMDDTNPLPRIRVEKNGEICFSIQCRHCEDPMCVSACLTGASQKDPVSGKVSVDPEKCIGCWTCVVACPYGALTRDTINHVVVKCDLCPDEEIPACVANCPNEALVLGQEMLTEVASGSNN